MTVAGSLERLNVAADSLTDVLAAARVTVCEDQPSSRATLAVDELGEALVELAGECETMRDAIRATLLDSAGPSRSEAARLVTLAQEVTNAIADGLDSRIMACDRLAEVERAARRGGPPWRRWFAATVRGLSECQPAVRDLRDALFACWRELTQDGSPIDAGRASGPRSGAPVSAEVPIVVAADGDLSGRFTIRSIADEPGGGREQ